MSDIRFEDNTVVVIIAGNQDPFKKPTWFSKFGYFEHFYESMLSFFEYGCYSTNFKNLWEYPFLNKLIEVFRKFRKRS